MGQKPKSRLLAVLFVLGFVPLSGLVPLRAQHTQQSFQDYITAGLRQGKLDSALNARNQQERPGIPGTPTQPEHLARKNRGHAILVKTMGTRGEP